MLLVIAYEAIDTVEAYNLRLHDTADRERYSLSGVHNQTGVATQANIIPYIVAFGF